MKTSTRTVTLLSLLLAAVLMAWGSPPWLGQSTGRELVLIPEIKIQRAVITARYGTPGNWTSPPTNSLASWIALNPHGYTNNLRETMTVAADGSVFARSRVLTGIRGTWVIGAALDEGRSFAKTMLVSGAPNEDFGKIVGHRLELVPQTDPFELPPNGSLRVQVLLESRPLPQASLTHHSGLDARSGRDFTTDQQGTAEIRITDPGLQLLRVRHPGDDPSGESATLTFLGPGSW